MAKQDFSILAKVVLDVADIQKQLNNAAKNIKNVNIKVNADGFDDAKDKADGLGKSVDDLSLTFNVANEMFRMAEQTIGDLVDRVYTLDDAVTELRKVTDLGGDSLSNYVDELAELGKQVGKSGKPNRSEPE